MGLAIIEFLIAVEDALGVRIPEGDAEAIATPRLLVNFLHGQLPQSHENRCLSQRAFYRIRGALVDRFGLDPKALRPDTEVQRMLPEAISKRHWAEIGVAVGIPKRNWPRIRGGGWFARNFLDRQPRTLGDAARQVASASPRALKQPGEGWAWNEIATVVDRCLRDWTGIEDYSWDDRFIEELRME